MITVTSTDGTDVRVHDEGRGAPILLVGPGLDDGTRCRRVAAILAERHRVLCPHRRQYRLDLKSGTLRSPRPPDAPASPGPPGAPSTIAEEVDDVLAIVRAVGGPVLLYGHSSGGVVALEALVASPASFAGAVIFEPPVRTGAPLTGENGEILARARTAVAERRMSRAATIFLGEVVGLSPWQARLAGLATASIPHYRRLLPSQLDDLEALDRLGVRLDTYARIDVETVLLGGDRSPAHLLHRLDAIGRVMPRAERVILRGRDHGADARAPREVARVIEALAERVRHRSE